MVVAHSTQHTAHSTQHTAHSTQHKLKRALLDFSTLGTLALFALAPLSAEKNGAFVGAGFQYSNFSGQLKASKPALEQVVGTWKMNGNLFGADIQIGYKQFFGKKKHFGLRYYGFFSGQGGPASFKQNVEDENGNTTLVTTNQQSANLFYGVGLDMLFNFYEKQERTFGVFAGVMVGGSSWLMGKGFINGECTWSDDDGKCTTMNNYFKARAKFFNGEGFKGVFSPTHVQVLVNLGVRANITQHQGFELGVRVPTIDDPYLTLSTTKDFPQYGVKKGDAIAITFRRNIAIFANYVYNF
ncbi:outer membrane protein [Helicobacter salomonis]|uniref:OMP2 n=1 Tax=Helicobacter salomonis TaxID=56878 RepID=A0A1M4NIR7_9HELI|nr:outer membrane protein [Helicobacter salomonis]SFZ73070.1 OMP2 [Helicobacter salomonis]